MKDRYGRKIDYLRLSITNQCNLSCKYCMPDKNLIKRDKKDVLTLEEIHKISKAFVSLGISKIRLTGGEPLVRDDLTDLVSLISGINGVEDLSLTTNGILLEKYAQKLKDKGLKRVNISIDTLDEFKYREITQGGDIRKLLKGIDEAKKVGLTPIKLNVVLIKGFNDVEIEDFVRLTINDPIDVRFIELMPVGSSSNWSVDRYLSNNIILEKVPELIKIGKDEASSTAVYLKLNGAKGRVGIINPISHKFCDDCNRIRVTATGKLKPCLHSNLEIDLRDVIEDEQRLKERIIKAVSEKSYTHHLEDGKYVKHDMSQIGG